MDNLDYEWDDSQELNITPLVDIMLVLLAILMVTTPTITYKENIVLAKGSKTAKVVEEPAIEVRVDIDKKIYVKDSTYSYSDFPDNFVIFSKGYDKKTEVHIRADKNLRYDDIIFILKTVKEAGFLKVSLVTNG